MAVSWFHLWNTSFNFSKQLVGGKKTLRMQVYFETFVRITTN